jgi:DNA-binding winged helix-turn-helix (wHTH) protein/tetratricopeptide (TPR) repeat protein
MKVFQPFRLDTVNHCLWRADERVALTPKAFDVLRYLVEHADRLVTQDEILEALWPGTYVNPEVVKKYVLGIRKVLKDHPDKPAFVATFPKRGYQFIAAVRDESTASASDLSANTPKTIVGREDALAQLDKCLTKALNGKRQVIFITGEAGIGKTTLLDVFHQRAASRPNLRISRGQCVEGFGGKEAYYPVLEALGQWFRAEDGGPVLHTLAKQAPTWLIQFPSLVRADQRAALQKEILGATRERMVREICEALESLTAQDALVLVLEDLHWVDPSTLDFISAFARRRGPAKLLLLGTYRPADVITSESPLKALKQDLVLHNLSCEIALERLERSDVAEYLAVQFVEGGLPAEFANLIYRHSGGNALFMVTILQDMVKKGVISQDNGRWTLRSAVEDVEPGVPETLDQLIELQFKQLTPVEQRILRSASVAGERFSVWAITTAAEVDPGIIEDACERLAERLQFIKTAGSYKMANGQISTHYDFRHSLYREVLYRRISEVSRSRLHLLLAQRLKAFCDPCEQELATELALHFEGGRDYEQAVRYLILAAENASRRFAYRNSIEILHHALELVAQLAPKLQVELEVKILESIGDAQFALGALPESAEAYEAAASRADKAGLKTAQAHALICAMYPLGFTNPDQGLAAMDQALQMSITVGDPLLSARAQMLSSSCRLVFDAWRHKDAELCASAHQALQRLDSSATDPYQQIAYAHVLALQGNYPDALQIFEAGISRTDHAIRLIPHFGALSGKTIALLRRGELGEVLRITQAGRELADENLARSWLLSFREAWLRILAFDYEGALRICETISMASARYHPAQPQIISLIAAGYMAIERREYSRAIELFEQVHDPDLATKFFLHWMWRMTAQLESGNVWLLCGQILKARVASDKFLESALSTADPHLQALAWDLKTRVAMAENDFARAREHIQNAFAILEKSEIPIAAWQTYATAWQLSESAKEQKAAEAYRERAESCILKIANSFEPDEPLRKSFLNAAPVCRILRKKAVSKATRLPKLRPSASAK